MKKLFYIALFGLLAFEVLNVYFIMPMPGSQEMNSISAAYFLYHWRWAFRGVLFLMLVYAYLKAGWKRKWVPFIPVVLAGVVVYFANFRMSADHMFRQPANLVLADAANNRVDTNRLVIGVVMNNEAKAYPIQFLGFHHMVQDTVGGKPLLITYCTVCRTGRVFDPVINGRHEVFRLVGMDHFNAMLEDGTTGSWWRQATGEAVAGASKGTCLAVVLSTQTTLGEWMRLYPTSRVMQADQSFLANYPTSFDYESGKSRSQLTGTDTGSWKNKSWVVGIEAGNESKAYDWNLLRAKRCINDKIGTRSISLVLGSDNNSFFAFETPDTTAAVTLSGDEIIYGGHKYRLDGGGIDTTGALTRIPAYQEFWHSWRTFHPATQQYH